MRDKVYVKNFGCGKPWLPGYLLQASGPGSFMVRLSDGQVMRRHTDHFRQRTVDSERSTQERTRDNLYFELDSETTTGVTEELGNSSGAVESVTVQDGAEARYTSRAHHPPERNS